MEVTSPTITIKVTGHQWYWSIYNDIVFEPGIFRRNSLISKEIMICLSL